MIKNILLLLFIIICGLIPISGYSLWTDEAWTITEHAIQPTFKSLIFSIVNSIGGDAQFPGYNIYIWFWVKLFGISELAVRYSNLPFYYLSLFFCLLYLPRSQKFNFWFIFLICFNPLIWFYLNEARYIISVFSFALLSLISVILYFEGEKRYQKLSVSVLFSSIILGTAFMMLFVFYIIPLAFLIYYYLKKTGNPVKRLLFKWKTLLIIGGGLYIFMGSYYLYTIINGAGGTRLNPDVKNFIFILYEFLGYVGIGPSRNILRESQSIELKSIYFLAILIFSIIYLGFLYLIVINTRINKNKLPLYGYAGLITSLLIFYLFAKYFQFKFLSRHLIFLYPCFIFYTYTLFQSQQTKYYRFKIMLIIFFFIGLGYSNYNIRFNRKYQKTDTFKAFIIANNESKGQKIMWVDDRHGFEYYTLYTNNAKNITAKNVVYIVTKPEDEIVEKIDYYIDKESYFIVVVNRKDYKKQVRNYLLSKSYQIYMSDQDYTMYRKTIDK